MPKFSPDPLKEYVLVYDYPSSNKPLVFKGTVVTEVKFAQKSHFMGSQLSFREKRTGIQYETHYGYMFAENTPENLKKLDEFHRIRDIYFAVEREMKEKFSEIATIRGPFEGKNG